jgi:hypothetical protein
VRTSLPPNLDSAVRNFLYARILNGCSFLRAVQPSFVVANSLVLEPVHKTDGEDIVVEGSRQVPAPMWPVPAPMWPRRRCGKSRRRCGRCWRRGTDMFLLDNGRVSVYEWNGNFVTTLAAGTIFGEMALLMGDFTRHATVR